MFSFIATIFGAVWISEHWKELVIGLAVLCVLLVILNERKKRRRAEYLALPVLYIGNSTTRTVHRTNCQKISNLSPQNTVAFRSVEEVRRSGYTPCGHCKP